MATHTHTHKILIKTVTHSL